MNKNTRGNSGKRRMFRMNKKGAEIATGLLPILALALLIFTLYAYHTFDKNLDFKSNQLAAVGADAELNEDYVVAQANLIAKDAGEKCLECEALELRGKIIEIGAEKETLFRYEGAGNFYAKIRNGEFEVESRNGEFVLKIEGLFVEAKQGENKMRRDFSLEVLIIS